MNLNLISIGKFIQDGRKHYEMTQAELAEKLGVSPQSVSNWERGESMPDIAKLEDLSRELGASIDAILGNMNNSLEYKGDFPAQLRLEHNYKVEIFNLEEQLKQCISMEDFGKAAEIRDKIKELQANEQIEDTEAQ